MEGDVFWDRVLLDHTNRKERVKREEHDYEGPLDKRQQVNLSLEPKRQRDRDDREGVVGDGVLLGNLWVFEGHFEESAEVQERVPRVDCYHAHQKVEVAWSLSGGHCVK